MKKEISILGLGSMGTAIALNLKKKYKIFGYDINKYNNIKSTKNFIFVKSLKEIFLKSNIFKAFYLNGLYLFISICLFYYSFSKARKKGTLINIGE